MSNKYLIKYDDNDCIEMIKPNSSILLYKIPYEEIKKQTLDISISNRFIVYILIGKNNNNEDIIYVGKSKNGIDQRPTSHETSENQWYHCFILTTFSERTFFNDGTIQYIENKIHERLKENKNLITTTKTTLSNTISDYDKEYCDEYIEEIYNMLYILGLDLRIPTKKVENITDISPVVSTDTSDVFKGIFSKLSEI